MENERLIDYKALMVGDFIRYRSDYQNKRLAGKVVEIKSVKWICEVRNSSGKYDKLCGGMMEPIPLTDDILRLNFPSGATDGKNKYNIHVGYGVRIDDNRSLWIGKWWNNATNEQAKETGENPAAKWWEVVLYDHYGYEHGTKVKYVHELQHAMKLFGVGMDIKMTNYEPKSVIHTEQNDNKTKQE